MEDISWIIREPKYRGSDISYKRSSYVTYADVLSQERTDVIYKVLDYIIHSSYQSFYCISQYADFVLIEDVGSIVYSGICFQLLSSSISGSSYLYTNVSYWLRIQSHARNQFVFL